MFQNKSLKTVDVMFHDVVFKRQKKNAAQGALTLMPGLEAPRVKLTKD